MHSVLLKTYRQVEIVLLQPIFEGVAISELWARRKLCLLVSYGPVESCA